MAHINIAPVSSIDIPTLAHITAQTFHLDRHTRVKQLGRKTFDLEPMFVGMLTSGLQNKNSVYVKAIDGETGEALGWIGVGFRGVEEVREKLQLDKIVQKSEEAEAENSKLSDRGEGADKETNSKEQQTQQDTEAEEDDSIARLHSLEDADMQTWMSRLMPPGKSCCYLTSLCVSPLHHGKGVGTQLLTYATSLADKLGLFMWVHASEDAYPLLLKNGFHMLGELAVDLDEYSPRAPSEEEVQELRLERVEGKGKWGVYTLRYMKRLPNIDDTTR